MVNRFRDWLKSSDSSVTLHRVLKWIWIIVGIPLSFYLRFSVPWLVFMSVYAIVVGHWSAEQSGIVEKKQDEKE